MEEVSSSLNEVNEEFINSILPPGWGTKIIDKKIIEGEDKFPNVQLHFVVNCTNQVEFGKWLTEFETLTNSSYVISNTDIEDGERIKLKRRLRCHHSTRCLKTYDPSSRNKTRNTNCPSKLTVKIHVIRKKYRGTQEKFKFLHEAPCEIILIATHNHMTGTADFLRFRKVDDNIKEELLHLYQNGHTAGTALEMIKCNIQLTCDDNITALADRNKCPSYKYCYDLYMKEFKKKDSLMKFDTEARDEDRFSISEDTSIPSTSIMTVPLPFDPDENKKRYTVLLAKIKQYFDKFYEKSPLEVTSSMEKMIATLAKIRRPASFSAAVAAFGFGAKGRQRRRRIIPFQKIPVGTKIIVKLNRKTNNVNEK